MRTRLPSFDIAEFEMEIAGRRIFVRAFGKILEGDYWNPYLQLSDFMIDVYERTQDDDWELTQRGFTTEQWAKLEEEAEFRLYEDFKEREESAREEKRHTA
jgi:hypothetical protein